MPKLEILIENDLERGKSEVIENEVSDEVLSDEDELQEEFKKEIKKIKLGMLQLIEKTEECGKGYKCRKDRIYRKNCSRK